MLLLFCAPAAARVIQVGPDREAKTLNIALARAKPGDEIVLDRATEHLTSGVVVRVDAIEIRSAPGAGEPATIRNTSTDGYPTTIDHRGEGLIVRDVVMAGTEGVNIMGIRAKGRRLIVDSVTAAPSLWGLVMLDGADHTVVRNCKAPVLTAYTVSSFGSASHDLLVERCTFLGSSTEHTIRLHKIHGARLRDSTFHVGGKKSALTIRDGANVHVENCTIQGAIAIGPLSGGDGGIDHPTATPQQRAKRDAMLRLSLRDVTLKNCTIDTPGIDVEMGTHNFVLDRCWIKTQKQRVLRVKRNEYEPWRSIASGRLVHCELSGPPGLRPFQEPRPTFHVIGTVINGERVADSEAPTTKPEDAGGAVPGEATPPSTAPTTQIIEQGGVHRADVMVALDRVDDALAQLHVARERLYSSTQPVAEVR